MAGKNTRTRSVATKSLFESAQGVISAAVSLNQGDFAILSSNLLAAPAAEGDGANLLGVMRDDVVLGKLRRPYSTDVDASAAVSDVGGPQYGDVFKCQLKAGDSLSPGDKVYLHPATSSRGVQASGTKAIGIYQGASAVTGGPSDNLTEIECLIGARFPDDVLKF
jgi:hypothetical protein